MGMNAKLLRQERLRTVRTVRYRSSMVTTVTQASLSQLISFFKPLYHLAILARESCTRDWDKLPSMASVVHRSIKYRDPFYRR